MLSNRCHKVWTTQRFDNTKLSETTPLAKFGAIEPPLVVVSFAMDNTASQRFDNTKFCERRPFRKFMKIWCHRTDLHCPHCRRMQRFDSTNFLKRHRAENLVLWNRPSLLSVFAMDNTAAQRFDSTI